jgi:hypothetical protein
MLRACVLSWMGNWEDHLALAKFAYNNSYHASIKIQPTMDESAFLHCVGKYLASACWLAQIGYNRLMIGTSDPIKYVDRSELAEELCRC